MRAADRGPDPASRAAVRPHAAERPADGPVASEAPWWQQQKPLAGPASDVGAASDSDGDGSDSGKESLQRLAAQ
eukprot:10699105-Alexandrium_andersonii.AAC.1